MEEKIKKALIIRLSSLGDVVIASSILEFLYRHEVEVHFAVYEEFADIFEGDPRISKLFRIKRTLKGKLAAIKEIRSEEYDLVVDLHKKFFPVILSLFARTKWRTSYRKNSFERYLAVCLKKKIEESPLHKRYVEVVKKYFEIKEVPLPELISLKKPDFELPPEYAVFVPGASKKTKRWPMEYFLELGKLIHERFKIPVVIIGKEKYAESYPEGFINLEHKTTLRELLYILKNARFVVSNDTGPAHMAAAVGTPLFVVFGPTIPEFGFRPAGKGYVKVFEKNLPCRPCSLHGSDQCPLGHLKCILDIKPEEIYNEIERFFSGSAYKDF